MFARFVRPLWRKLVTPRVFLTTTAILSYTLLKNKLILDSPLNHQKEDPNQQKPKKIQQYIKNLQTVDVCQGKDLLQGQRKVVVVKDHNGIDHKIIIMRRQGSLYAFLGNCPHQQPFQVFNSDYSLQKAMVFNDKLYCPHHGCVFDIKSGSIEYGPTLSNLPIFLVQQNKGIIQLIYPSAIPTSIEPNSTQRDVQDLRKVMILGGDDAATVGCINGLRQFGYQGQITVVKQGPYTEPYKKQYLHKKMLNLHLHDKDNTATESIKQKNKKTKENTNDKLIEQQLEQQVYNKLKYYTENWYEYYGVYFVFTDQAYRIINKQYYPYVTFADGSKLQYDALLVATGLTQKIPTYEGITTDSERELNINLPQNVFCPLRSKQQHLKLNKFLNNNLIKSLLVMGYNIESLEFVQAVKKEFPNIKLTVIDPKRDSSVSEFIGPDLEKAITKQFKQRDVDFFIKVRDQLLFSNKFSSKNLKKKAIQPKSNQKNNEKQIDSKLKYEESVTVRLNDETRLKADGVVIFPHEFSGNTEWVKNGKYTDFDFFNENRFGADTFGRTDNIRIFSAGLSSSNDYFLLNRRLVSTDATTAYEQGFNVGLNMQALRIPFTYVPFQKYQFFGKKFFYTGTHDFFDSVLVIGSIEDWDFLSVYALGSKVMGVSASPSRSHQLAVVREAMRVNCMASFTELLNGYWSIENLNKLIKKLNRSGCYRDVIFQNRENIHKKDLLWMERTPDAGFENDRPQPSEEFPSVEVGADGTLKEL